MKCRIVAAVLAGALAGAACSGAQDAGWVEVAPAPADAGEILRITGTVHKLDVEGGVFVIRDAEGTHYNPTNLPEAFRTDGMAVETEARRRDDSVSIGMVGPLIELIRIRKRAGADAVSPALAGTTWRLDDLAGAGVVGSTRATLEFAGQGEIGGNGTCNSFGGSVTFKGDAMKVGPLMSTQMACAESAAMDQESRYLAALQQAERFEIRAPHLYIYTAAQPQPLRFIAADDPVVGQLIAQADAWDKAIVQKDRAAIESNMAEDFRQVDGDGNLESKATFVDGVLSPDLAIDPYVVEDLDVRIYGDVALLSGRTRMTGRHQDKPFISHYRYTDVYVRRSDGWKIVSVQITRIPQ